jgi:hypothetical protein
MTTAATPDRDVRWAWGFVVLIVAGGVLAQFLGYGIAVLLGYDVPEASTPSLVAALVISIPALVVALAPALAALLYGIRAGRGGRYSGYVAAAVGALAAVYWVVGTAISLIALVMGGT